MILLWRFDQGFFTFDSILWKGDYFMQVFQNNIEQIFLSYIQFYLYIIKSTTENFNVCTFYFEKRGSNFIIS